MKNTYRLVVGALVMLMAGLLLVNVASAAEPDGKSSITVSPLVFDDLTANPGDSMDRELRIDNTSDKSIDFEVSVRNFVALGEEGQVSLTDEDTTYSLAKWIKTDPSTFTLAAKSFKTVKFTIDVPGNAEPGGHFGSVVIKTKPTAEPGKVAVSQQVSPLILLKVAGKANENASIESFKVNPTFSETGPFKFELRVRNAGNIHVKPKSTVTITDMFGKEVAKLQYDARNVLPDSIRHFETEWKPTWLMGPYTAKVTTVYGTEGQVLVAETSFWGFPTTAALIILIPLLILIVVLITMRKRLGRAFGVLFGKESSSRAVEKEYTAEPSDNDESESHVKHRSRKDQ